MADGMAEEMTDMVARPTLKAEGRMQKAEVGCRMSEIGGGAHGVTRPTSISRIGHFDT
jgi:hypothetical protein